MEGSTSALEEVVTGPALEIDRAYWLEYCPDHCPPLLATSWTDPTMRVLGQDADGTSAIALVEYTDSWPEGEPVPAAEIVRLDARSTGGWVISLATRFEATDGLPDLPDGEVTQLASAGQELATAYLALRDRLSDREPYPADPEFADGPFTSGLPDVIATWMETPADQISTTEAIADDETASTGFTISSGSASFHCGLRRRVEVTQGRDGQPLSPDDALGDYGHLLEPGRYTEFVVTAITTVCVLTDEGAMPVIVVAGEERTTVTATEANQS